MNKTVNINLAGTPFIIDEEAYVLLDQYLNAIGEVCSKAGIPETTSDIEQRIAEIVGERYGKGGIVTITDIRDVIGRIGEPEEIIGVEKTTVEEAPVNNPGPQNCKNETPTRSATLNLKKRLFRDPRNKMLGGVCSGLAWYLGIDPVWVRLAFVALCFISFSTLFVIYLILWIVVPEAKTPGEQLQMMGMESSVQNVGRVVTDTVPPPFPEQTPSSGKRLASTVVEICGWIGKVLFFLIMGLGVVVLGSMLLALGACLIVAIIALLVPSVPAPLGTMPVSELKLTLGVLAGFAMFFGIPVAMMIRWLCQLMMKRPQPLSTPMKTGLLITWIVGLILMLTCGAFIDFAEFPNYFPWNNG